uniref:Ovule protein n=1 Tax=Meloidogyne incognita TaxID=6306 RepID=A0A914L283_MELIC
MIETGHRKFMERTLSFKNSQKKHQNMKTRSSSNNNLNSLDQFFNLEHRLWNKGSERKKIFLGK